MKKNFILVGFICILMQFLYLKPENAKAKVKMSTNNTRSISSVSIEKENIDLYEKKMKSIYLHSKFETLSKNENELKYIVISKRIVCNGSYINGVEKLNCSRRK